MHSSVRLWHPALEEQQGWLEIHYLKFLFLFLTRFHAAPLLSSPSFSPPNPLFWGVCVWQFFSNAAFVPFCFCLPWAPPPALILCVPASFSFSVRRLPYFPFSLPALLSHIIQTNKFSFCLHSSARCYGVVVSPFRTGALAVWAIHSSSENSEHMSGGVPGLVTTENNQSNQESCSLKTAQTSLRPVDLLPQRLYACAPHFRTFKIIDFPLRTGRNSKVQCSYRSSPPIHSTLPFNPWLASQKTGPVA